MQTVAIIGGGASGMIAALTASENKENQILLFEKEDRVGRKILSTGNGRCNLSNSNADPSHYYGDNSAFCSYALDRFSWSDTLGYFASLGLITKSEPDGRIYPNSNQAAGVLDILRFSLERENISLYTSCTVKNAKKKNDHFILTTDQGTFTADKLIIACGGSAAPKLGGCSLGYDLLRSFGHKILPLSPALVQLKTDTTYIKALKGIKSDASVRLLCGKKLLAETTGEVLFTEYGISGPAIFSISRHLRGYEDNARLELNLLPNHSFDEILNILSLPRKTTCENLLTGLLSKRLGQAVVKYCNIPLSKEIAELNGSEKRRIASALLCFPLSVKGTTGFAHAQVTAGGADTAQFDEKTMQSRIVSGLYACGEVLDIDGDCGGYNLQWAWSSGRLAGRLL